MFLHTKNGAVLGTLTASWARYKVEAQAARAWARATPSQVSRCRMRRGLVLQKHKNQKSGPRSNEMLSGVLPIGCHAGAVQPKRIGRIWGSCLGPAMFPEHPWPLMTTRRPPFHATYNLSTQ